jgi:mersacidin/lichenicidin family type 2 lantibiotic
MSQSDIIRVWKDPVYRSTLGAQELAALPPNPAGAVELTEQDLSGDAASGSLKFSYCICTTSIICPFSHDTDGG